MKVKDYKDLRVWQKGIEMVDKIYKETEKLPDYEKYGLVNQMRRSAVSIPSNIAEGFVRRGKNEYRQFLYISLGSCAELETQLIITHRRSFINQFTSEELLEDIRYEMRMLVSLIYKL